MARPQPIVEAYIDGAWVDLTALRHVRLSGGINISRGRAEDAQRVDPSSCRLSLNNTDGRYSPRNPNSPYYGKLGRNTPIRVRFDHTAGGGYLYLSEQDQRAVTTAAGPNVTDDIDVRIDLEPVNWNTSMLLAGKYNTTGNQRSWALWITSAWKIQWRNSSNGSITLDTTTNSRVPFVSGRGALRVTHDVNNGAGSNVVTFYTAPSLAGPWSLFEQFTNGGTTAIFDSTAQLEVGNLVSLGGADTYEGRVYGLEVRDGINGTLIVDTDFETQIGGQGGTVTDATALTWTLSTDAYIINPATRFTGEVSAWPQKWDLSGNDVYVPIEAAGILRRLGQGASPLRSAIYREIGTRRATTAGGGTATLNAYWPLEDGDNATSAASGIPDQPPLSRVGSPTWTTGERPPGSTGSVSFAGAHALKGIALGTSAGAWTFELWFRGEPGATGTFNVKWFTPHGNTARSFTLAFNLTADTIALSWADASGSSTSIFSGAVTNLDDGTWRHILLTATTTVGSDFELFENGVSRATGSAAASVLGGKIQTLQVGNGTTGADTMAQVCHVAIWDDVLPAATHEDAGAAYVAETAGNRIDRLCSEEDIPLLLIGDPGITQKLGPQAADTLGNLLQEAADVDMGVLFEPREFLGLAYRTRDSFYNQTAVLPLAYEGNGITQLEPVDDDSATRNDVTVSRGEGSSFRVEQEDGPLSVLPPPDGIGRYDDSVTINVHSDADLPDQAGWRLHLGTVDEPRFPQIELGLQNPGIAAVPSRILQATKLDVGDRLTVSNLPSWLPPEQVSQIAQGFTETITDADRRILVNCSPESPYSVGMWWSQADTSDTAADAWDTAGSELYAAVGASDTTLQVVTTVGSPWTTDAADLPFDIMIGGERMTVTAITNSGAPIGLVNTGAGYSNNNASGAPGLPAALAVNDVVLIFASIRNTAATVNTPGSWTKLSGFGGTHAAIFGRVYNGVWTMPTITYSGGAAGDDTIGQVAAFRGIDLTLDAQSTQSNASAQDILTPALDVTSKGQLVIWAGWKQDDWTDASHANALAATINSRVGTAGNDAGQVWSYRIFNPATDIGASQFGITGGAAAISRSAVMSFARLPQQFTVTRSVNGIVKSHALGDPLSLFNKSYWVM